MRKVFTLFVVASSIAAFHACTYKDKETLYPEDLNTCDTVSVTYSNYVSGFITTSCATAGCHSAASASSGIDLSNYAGLKTIADNGRLMGSINHQSGYSPMPQNQAKLDACAIAKIQFWVGAGALNN